MGVAKKKFVGFFKRKFNKNLFNNFIHFFVLIE